MQLNAVDGSHEDAGDVVMLCALFTYDDDRVAGAKDGLYFGRFVVADDLPVTAEFDCDHFAGRLLANAAVKESWVIGRVAEIRQPVRAYPWFAPQAAAGALYPATEVAGAGGFACSTKGIVLHRPRFKTH